MVVPNRPSFSQAFILLPSMIFVKSTWGSMRLSTAILKFVVFSELFRQYTDANQNIVGDSWEQMFISFRRMVMYLYKEWYQYLKDSLDSEEEAYFNSIRLNTAEKLEWMDSLTRLSKLLRKKSGRPVMVFIDEYEAPINRAYECNFFSEVCSSYPPRLWSPRLRTVI
jgi:hypothetical protein